MTVLLTRSIEFIFLPPGNIILVVLLIVLLRSTRFTRLLLGAYVLQITLFSLPISSHWLMQSLSPSYPPIEIATADPLPQAIVVLGAGRNRNAHEYNGESSSLIGIERLRYAAAIQRQTGLPILVTGGRPIPTEISEARLMAQTLEQEFNARVRWLEEDSHTTYENAVYTDKLLIESGVTRAWLVTHAWHMPRSMQVFKQGQIEYIAAPCSYSGNILWVDGMLKYVPQASALSRSIIALHEHIGLQWYRLKGYVK